MASFGYIAITFTISQGVVLWQYIESVYVNTGKYLLGTPAKEIDVIIAWNYQQICESMITLHGNKKTKQFYKQKFDCTIQEIEWNCITKEAKISTITVQFNLTPLHMVNVVGYSIFASHNAWWSYMCEVAETKKQF